MRAQQTVTIESNKHELSSWCLRVVICTGPLRILYLDLVSPIIRSTCILTDAIFLVSSIEVIEVIEHGCN